MRKKFLFTLPPLFTTPQHTNTLHFVDHCPCLQSGQPHKFPTFHLNTTLTHCFINSYFPRGSISNAFLRNTASYRLRICVRKKFLFTLPPLFTTPQHTNTLHFVDHCPCLQSGQPHKFPTFHLNTTLTHCFINSYFPHGSFSNAFLRNTASYRSCSALPGNTVRITSTP